MILYQWNKTRHQYIICCPDWVDLFRATYSWLQYAAEPLSPQPGLSGTILLSGWHHPTMHLSGATTPSVLVCFALMFCTPSLVIQVLGWALVYQRWVQTWSWLIRLISYLFRDQILSG
jgi:hypothetical protein